MREPLRDLLVQTRPQHFAPKGRGDAEAIFSFQLMVQGIPEKFQFEVAANIQRLVRYAMKVKIQLCHTLKIG